ncbi:uncharacterized protein LOC134258882 [Saccostrea cucullata]|uniref:uncharacterized protein LOC134258882 n=1 Tax=Saccostrea cuccullata TaxID=36930 RepID=UPI002ED1DE2E
MDELPDIPDEYCEHQAFVKRKRVIKFCDQEIILMLRSYQVHPCAWIQIRKSMLENIHQLPSETQNMYKSSSVKQIKDRLSAKLSKLLSMSDGDIENITIRNELKKVRSIEMKLARPTCYQGKQAGSLDPRSQITGELSSDEDETLSAGPSKSVPCTSKSASANAQSASAPVPSSPGPSASFRSIPVSSAGSSNSTIYSNVLPCFSSI